MFASLADFEVRAFFIRGAFLSWLRWLLFKPTLESRALSVSYQMFARCSAGRHTGSPGLMSKAL